MLCTIIVRWGTVLCLRAMHISPACQPGRHTIASDSRPRQHRLQGSTYLTIKHCTPLYPISVVHSQGHANTVHKHTEYIDQAMLYRKRPQIQRPVTWPALCLPVRPLGWHRNKSPATSSGRSAGCSQGHSDWAQLPVRRSFCILIRKHPAQTIHRAARKNQVTLHGLRDGAGQDRDRANAPLFIYFFARTPLHSIVVSTLPRQCRSQGFNIDVGNNSILSIYNCLRYGSVVHCRQFFYSYWHPCAATNVCFCCRLHRF